MGGGLWMLGLHHLDDLSGQGHQRFVASATIVRDVSRNFERGGGTVWVLRLHWEAEIRWGGFQQYAERIWAYPQDFFLFQAFRDRF